MADEVRRLPTPDEFGNYWLGPPGLDRPAILPIKSDIEAEGKYMLVLGPRTVWTRDGKGRPRFKAYDTAQEALKDYRRLRTRKGGE